MVRTRIAPAACTHLSLRELQSTLLNWLFARSKGGKFVVRIGEMDLARGRAETVHRILDDIQWLEVDWDEGPDIGGSLGPYLQSERGDRYAKALDKICQSDRVYPFAPERDGEPAEEGDADAVTRWRQAERPFHYRYRLDRSAATPVRDLVHGSLDVSLEDFEDPIIRRADGSASPFLAQIVDDAEMRISHIFRPDAELDLTAAEAAVYQELNLRMPRMAHYPSLIGNDGKPYSRRHGAFTVDSFKKLGYLPSTLCNYLVFLAWARRGLGTKFDIHELGEKFHVAGIRKEPREFQFPELNVLSTQYICAENLDHLADRVLPYLIEGRFLDEDYDRDKLKRILNTIRPSLKCLSEIVKYVDIFFGETVIEARGREVLKDEASGRVLRLFREYVGETGELDEEAFEQVLERIHLETGYEVERMRLPIRAALTGITQGGGGGELEKIASILGAEECIGKVDRVLTDGGRR